MKKRLRNKLLKNNFQEAALKQAAFLQQYYKDVQVVKMANEIGYRVIVTNPDTTTVYLINKKAPYHNYTQANANNA